jgi:hypothetical protein
MRFKTKIDGSADPDTATPHEIRIRSRKGLSWPDLLADAGEGDAADWRLARTVRAGDHYAGLKCKCDPDMSEIQLGSEWVTAPNDTTIDVSVRFSSPSTIAQTQARQRALRELIATGLIESRRPKPTATDLQWAAWAAYVDTVLEASGAGMPDVDAP